MADTKLDQSLDEIVTQRKVGGGRGGRGGAARARGGRTSRGGAASVAAPVGGVRKSSRTVKPVSGAVTVPSGPNVGDRIQVSNLPKDITEHMIKEYFSLKVGPIKRVEINYGPGGVSRGTATVSFRNADGPRKAVDEHNGILVDGKPMRIDIIVSGRAATTLTTKSLGDRISAPKNQPKAVGKKPEAAKGRAAGAAGAGAAAASTRGKKGGKARAARPAKKTAAELDSEMADYFEQGGAGGAAAANGAAGGDQAMGEAA